MQGLFTLFRKISNDEAHFATELTLENIKLPEFLRLCMDAGQANEVCAYLQNVSNAEDIIDKQNFFKALISSDFLHDMFAKAEKELMLATQLLELFHKEKDTTLKLYYFYRFMEVYLILLYDISTSLENNSNHGSVLAGFASGITSFCQEEPVQAALRDIRTIRRVFEASATKQDFEIRLYGSSLLGYNSIPVDDVHQNLGGQLLGLFSDLGMDVSNVNKARHLEGDTAHSYIWMIIKNDSQLHKRLLNYYEQHKPLLESITIDAGDIPTILGIKALHDFLVAREIPLCFPGIAPRGSRAVTIHNCHDLSLFGQKAEKIIPNHFISDGEERIFILTGVNSGGKTTYLRGLGVAIAFFNAGLFIPATNACIPCFEEMTALFAGATPNIRDGAKRFIHEKEIVYKAIENSKPSSFILVNELFSSIDERTALAEYGQIINLLQQKTCFCLMITHYQSLPEWVQPYPEIVSLMAATGNNNERLYKIIRSQGSYSNVLDILRKYALTPDLLNKEV